MSISIDEFKKLRNKKIDKVEKCDWNAVLDEIDKINEAITVTRLREIALKHCVIPNPKFYYSEFTRILDRWERGRSTSVMRGVKDGRVYYLIRKTGVEE